MPKNRLGLQLPSLSGINNQNLDGNGKNVDSLSTQSETSECSSNAKPVNRSLIRVNTGEQNRNSTGPVDIKQVQKRLESMEVDENQRQKLLEFVAQKQKVAELIADDFECLQEIGKGNGGVVAKVRHTKTGLIMARKNIHLEIKPAIKAQIIRELMILHDCNSPYIVGYFGAFFSDGEISLCMEYMNGGSLDLVLKRIGRFPEPIIAEITCSVLRGLIYLRENLGIIHRDVKPSNILVNLEGDVKLCDFGVSGKLIDSMANSFVGTRSYMAPERLLGEDYNVRSDVWSLGLTLFELGTGRYPIPEASEQDYFSAFSKNQEENVGQQMRAAVEGVYLKAMEASSVCGMAIFELLAHIVDNPPPRIPSFCFTENFVDFVHACLQSNASDRPSLEALLGHSLLSQQSLQGDTDASLSTSALLLGPYLRALCVAIDSSLKISSSEESFLRE